MRKEKDIQALEKVSKLLDKAFEIITNDIENQDEIFNSNQALEVLENYSSITTSIDELIFDLVDYFEELAFIHEKE